MAVSAATELLLSMAAILLNSSSGCVPEEEIVNNGVDSVALPLGAPSSWEGSLLETALRAWALGSSLGPVS